MPTAFPPGSPGPVPERLHKMPSSSAMGMEDGGGADENMVFDSSSDEAAYYRDKYRRVADFLEETRAELDEFQASSKELEDELEKELAATEKQQAELKDRIKRLEGEKEEWKAKHIGAQKMHSSTVSAMQREMDNLRSERDKTLVALRDLEMGNDELERNERVAVSSLLDLESKYNRAIEEKTLLEQEVVQKAEVEEEFQRMKDELRDANDQISILRDQLSRTALPTPPSSISVPLSPSRSAIDLPENETADISTTTVEAPSSPSAAPSPGPVPLPKVISRSGSGLSGVSPTLRRATTQIPGTPLGGMARSHTARNLAAASTNIGSPSLSRSRSGIPQPSPMRAPSEQKYPLSRAAKMVTDLRRRIKATDDRMGGKATRRVVSNPSAENTAGPNTGTAGKAAAAKPVNSRLAALSNDSVRTPVSGNAASSILSPNGWILVDEPDSGVGEDGTPTPHPSGLGMGMASSRADPISPLDSMQMAQHPRAVSNASTATTSRGLPARPSIPSPLMTLAAARQDGGGGGHGTPTPHSHIPTNSSSLAKSTTPTTARPPSRSTMSQPSRAPSRSEGARPPSRSALASSTARGPTASSSARSVSRSIRPMSPATATGSSMMSPSAYSRSGARSPGPNTLQTLSASVSSSSRRPSTAGQGLGRGPPPTSALNTSVRRQLSMSVSSSSPSVAGARGTTATTPSRIPVSESTDLRRRRSSMGPGKEVDGPAGAEGEGYFNLAKSQGGYATPGRTPPATGLSHSHGPGGKGRPVSVPHFGTPPPDVPRIPSMHLKEKRRTLQQG
ncbi:uncharacterized protein MKK02DRAFT_38814 [Dioszegia hungarica]|uniref:NUDE domain-containing protein n=1 Tax=Dioszegia hungarica TaxID=4972 RepID=A0AA38H3S9_9TREE|nr:uncharacterized protein MKK02DRAFT_38814 [Dioszegia hungarica]KAI9634142.1 hypothetical protein MKK02DRAFT_38814 [Dioszegia hungarica]